MPYLARMHTGAPECLSQVFFLFFFYYILFILVRPWITPVFMAVPAYSCYKHKSFCQGYQASDSMHNAMLTGNSKNMLYTNTKVRIHCRTLSTFDKIWKQTTSTSR